MKTLITFVHFKRSDQIYEDNLNFFIKMGLNDSKDNHFNFVINSPTGGEQIPIQENVSIIKGHNQGYDFGAYKESIDNSDWESFDRFIFMNDTCRGPFTPNYVPESINWVDMFLNDLDKTVKLVGPTWVTATEWDYVHNMFDILPGKIKHIQSYCFGMDRVCLELILNNNMFTTTGKSRINIIGEHEIGLSQLVLDTGYEIKPLQLSRHSNIKHIDIVKNGQYFKDSLNPLEIMFIKTTRMQNQTVSNYTEWFMNK